MEREQIRKEEVERKERDRSSSLKNEYTTNYWWSTRIMIVSAPDLAKVAGDPTVEPVLIERVERMNAVIANLQ